MSAPVVSASGNQTPHRLLTTDLNTGTPSAPSFQTIQYVEDNDFNPDDAVMADSGIFGDAGWGNQDVMGATWHASITLNHMIVPNSSPPVYDPTHLWLESNAVGKFQRRAQLRFYDFDLNDLTGVLTPRGQAYMGFATWSWPGFGTGGTNDKRLVVVPFIGKGPLYPITHPYALAAAVPTIWAMQGVPLATAGSAPFRITGQGFTGATAVNIAGAAATSFHVWNDNEITGVAAAHAAGTALPVIVTNTVGASATANIASYA